MSSYTTTSIDNPPFSKWTPLIGIYISGATFVCVIAVVLDLWKGVGAKQYWIPSNWSSTNAAAITIITAASKLSLDLTTSMPRQIDQLCKLSTSAFVCIVLANVAPSVKKFGKSEFLSNIVALMIFGISSAVGVYIQLTTGVIFTFKTAHVIMVVTMSILLFVCVHSSLALTAATSYFNVNFEKQHQKALEDVNHRKPPTTEKLKLYLERFYMLAHSSCPLFIMARSTHNGIYTVFGLVAAMSFFTILSACITHKDKFLGPTSRNGTSNYGWSALYILISQTIGIGVGTIVSCIRGYYVFSVQSKKGPSICLWKIEGIETKNYWMKNPGFRNVIPFLPYIEYRQHKCLRLLYPLEYVFYTAGIYLFLIYIIISGFLFSFIPKFIWACILSVMPAHLHRDEEVLEPEEHPLYFLVADTTFAQIGRMVKSVSRFSKKCLGVKKRKTKHLRDLLQQYNSGDFEGVVKFQIPSSPDSQEPPHSWSLSVLALTCIATVLPNISSSLKDELRKSVMQGMFYVKLIENYFNNKPDFAYLRQRSTALWLVLRWNRMHGFDSGTTAKEALRTIERDSRSAFENPNRPLDRLGLVEAHDGFPECEMILRDCENIPDESNLVFDRLCCMISDILGACLINLKRYFLLECERSSLSAKNRREAACEILKYFGETEEILKILEKRQIPDIPPEEMVHMDNWCKSQSQSHHHHRQAQA